MKNPTKMATGMYCEIHHSISDIDVASLRHKYRMTQQQFADMLGISVKTVEGWEQGTRKPSSPARTLLVRVQADWEKKAA